MNYEAVTHAILKHMGNKPLDHGAYTDLLSACRQWEQENFQAAHAVNGQLKALAAKMLKECSPKEASFFYEMWRKSLLFDAPHFFDSFLLYIELDRKPEDRFYAPRRHYLKPMVQGYQDVLDGKLRLLTISEPKRAGKSQTGINFVNMISGKYPDRSTLMEGTGDDLVKSFYNGCLEYLVTPNEYLFYDVFPEAKLVQTNADIKVINLKTKSRFPTVMCRSIDARQVGLSEATNVLYLDDCVEGREEAKNRQRLDDKWEIISGDIMGRAIEGTPIVATGTRYSLYDPIGRLQEEAQKQGWTWRAVEIPALDPITDESNYEYYNPKLKTKVFTTAYFREQRELLSAEQFESEFQQQPFEAKGLLFNKKELNYFFELPIDRDPDAIIAVIAKGRKPYQKQKSAVSEHPNKTQEECIMAKIDVTKIEGYDQMTPEEKLAALEGFEYEDNAAEMERLKNANSKANSEAAEWKRKHNALISEDEKKKQEDADRFAQMEKELADLRKDKAVSEHKAKFIAQGYPEALAEDTAKAMADGDTAKVFANMGKFLTDHDKALKAEMLKGTPTPPAGDGSDGMTLEKLRKLSDEDYNKFAIEHPEEYKALYEKGE